MICYLSIILALEYKPALKLIWSCRIGKIISFQTKGVFSGHKAKKKKKAGDTGLAWGRLCYVPRRQHIGKRLKLCGTRQRIKFYLLSQPPAHHKVRIFAVCWRRGTQQRTFQGAEFSVPLPSQLDTSARPSAESVSSDFSGRELLPMCLLFLSDGRLHHQQLLNSLNTLYSSNSRTHAATYVLVLWVCLFEKECSLQGEYIYTSKVEFWQEHCNSIHSLPRLYMFLHHIRCIPQYCIAVGAVIILV